MSRIQELIESNANFAFDSQDYVAVIGHGIWTGLGFLGALVLLVALAKSGAPTTSNMFLMSLCCADLLMTGPPIFFSTIHALQGGWSTGVNGCLFNTITHVGGAFTSLFSICSINAERYLYLVHGYTLSTQQAWIIMVSYWSFSFFLVCIPIITNTYGFAYALVPSKVECCLSWWDYHPVSIFMTVSSLTIIVTAVSFYIYFCKMI